MERPGIAKITFWWVDDNGNERLAEFTESSLEQAEELIGLMTGNICEDDLNS